MFTSKKNNIYFKLWAGLSTIWDLLIIWEWKETLIDDFASNETDKQFKATLVKYKNWVVFQTEIIKVLSKTWKNLTIERAVEQVPMNWSSTELSQTPYEFAEWDMLFMNITAWDLHDLSTLLDDIQSSMVDNSDDTYTQQWNTFNEPNKLILADENWLVPQANLPETPVPEVNSFSQTLTAWEDLNALQVYRRWDTSLWEDETKFYKSLANDTNKLKVDWIVTWSALTDEEFVWAFEWIVGGFSGLIGQSTWIGGDITEVNITGSTYSPNSSLTLRQTFTIDRTTTLKSIKPQLDNSFSGVQMRIFKDNVLYATSLNTAWNYAWDFTFTFWNIELTAGVYEIRFTNTSWWEYQTSNFRVYVTTSSVYSGWAFYENWLEVNKDMEMTIITNDYTYSNIWNNLYLQDDWSIWAIKWTNSVVVWTIYSDTEIELLPKANTETSTTATTWSVTLWNAEGYITININGENKKIPYYWD